MDELTREELESIVKAIVAWNSGKLEFDPAYLKYANMFELNVERTDNQLTLKVHMPPLK